jgi:hypothetical protein
VARVQGTYTRYQLAGDREDLSDIISNISPTETPFFSNSKKGSASNTFFEWQQDALAAAAQNHVVEGNKYTVFTTQTATTRVGNWAEISDKNFSVSGTADALDTAGRAEEYRYTAMKAGRELKRDMEVNLTANNAGTAGAEGTARETGSILAFIKTNDGLGTNGASPVYSTTPTDARSDGTARTFTETLLQDVLQLVWTAGGDPSILMMNAYQKRLFSAFSGVATLYRDQQGEGQATIIAAADVYVSDWGTLYAVPNRFMRTSDCLVLDKEHMEVKFLRPFQSIELAKRGDSREGLILAEYGLCVANEAAHGLVADLAVP